LPLIATVDLDALKIWSLRGDSHRPGVRGLRLHRPALEQATSKAIHAELAAEILVVDSAHARKSVHWHGEDPFPLERLLELDDGLTARTLGIDDALSNRLRTAARWHAESHWSSDAADAVLALGVAFDALLAEPGGGPGRVIIERRALLEPRLDQRADRARTMREIYEARSSVAHGGRSSKLSESGFLRSASRELRITARQLVALGAVMRLGSEKDVAAAFEDLRWGTLRIDTPASMTSDLQPESEGSQRLSQGLEDQSGDDDPWCGNRRP
jgi:Apea-like HEPN